MSSGRRKAEARTFLGKVNISLSLWYNESIQEEAQRALQRVRAAFPAYGREMIIVRDRINVWGN